MKGVVQAGVNGSLDQSRAVGMESRARVQEVFWRVKRPTLRGDGCGGEGFVVSARRFLAEELRDEAAIS